MTPQLVPNPEELFDLEDVDIETVGLVTRGANRQQFFLLKSDKGGSIETTMSDESTAVVSNAIDPTDETAEKIAKSFWSKLRDFVRGEVAKAAVPEDKSKPDEDESEDEDKEKTDTEDKPAEEKPVEKEDTSIVMPVANLVAVVTSIPETPNAGSTEGITNMPDNTSDISALEKADLLSRLEKAEKELAQAREEKERQVFISKAQSQMTGLPCNPIELADQLYFLSKSDPKRAEWWEANLTAWNNIISDASLYIEKGTTAPSENSDPVIKAAASTDPRAALLSVKSKDAWNYILERQKATK